MLSDAGIERLSEKFICVKVDPRESSDAREYKRTGYVPEIIFLDSSKNYLGILEDRSVEGMREMMQSVLRSQRR